MKNYRGERPKPKLAYPPTLPDYVGQKVNLIPEIPVGKPFVTGKLTIRRESYFVGTVSVCPGDGIHSEDMRTFIGRVQKA